jgi:hypothetical protein
MHSLENTDLKQRRNKILFPDFICWRGLLTTLITTPYERQKDWMFSIILYKGTYYLCEIDTELNRLERTNRDEKNKAFTYWGFKFESYVTSNSPDSNHDEVLKLALGIVYKYAFKSLEFNLLI